MSPKKELVYPVFLECCQYTNDKFWESTFEDLAYGKPPSGTYIHGGFLCCSYKDRKFSYKIENQMSKKLYDNVYKLLVTRLGMISGKEKIKKKMEFHRVENDIINSRQKWKTISSKNIKDLFIEHYVINMKHKYDLSIKQTRFLLSIILIAMLFKVITSKDITYKDGCIQDIKGIEFKPKHIILKRKLYNRKTIVSSEQKITCKETMSDNWEKYLKKLIKKTRL